MPRLLLAALALVGLLAAGCTTPVSQDVFEEGGIKVFLRAEKRWQLGPIIEQGYDHPITIAPVRIGYILSRIDARQAGKKQPAIQTEMVFKIAEGISRALARADSDQQVVVMAKRSQRSLGVFDHDYLTSMVVYAKGDQLFIHLGRLDWEVPQKDKEKPPQPHVGEHRQNFRVYPSEAMELVDEQSVAANWRDPIFARATRTKVLPTGKVVRKTILLESDVEDLPEGAEAPVAESPVEHNIPSGLSPAQLRALADLEEARQAGTVSEAEYAERQREIVAPSESTPPDPPPSAAPAPAPTPAPATPPATSGP